MRRAVLGVVAVSIALSACTPSIAMTNASREATPAIAPSTGALESASPSPAPVDKPITRQVDKPVVRSSPQPSANASSATPEAFWAQEPAESVPEVKAVEVPISTQPAPVGSFVLGDSIILSPGVGPVLQQRGYVVAGTVGQGVSSGYLTENLLTMEAQGAPAWVIELGTNNPGDPATVAQLEGWIDLVDTLRSELLPQDVYWVLPHRPAQYVGAMDAYPLDAFSAEIQRLADERTWLTTLDYASAAQANPQWFDADNAMHLHPDEVGQDYLVRLIAGAEG